MESTAALQGVINLANEHPNFNCTNVVLLDGTVNTSLEIEQLLEVCFSFSKLTPHKGGQTYIKGGKVTAE